MANTIASQVMLPAAESNSDLGALMVLGGAQSVGTIQAGPFKNANCRGIKVIVNITAIGGTSPTLVVTLQGWDQASQTAYTILASASITATGQHVLDVFPGAPVATGTGANDQMPDLWQVSATFGGTSPSFTGTVSACLMK